MKTFKSISIILLSMMAGLSITGCNDNENPDSPSGMNKRIKTILYDSGAKATFSYNKDGKVSQVDLDNMTYHYQWDNKHAIKIGKRDNTTGEKEEYGSFTLEKNRIVAFESTEKYSLAFYYDDNGKLIKAIRKPNNSDDTESEIITYSWEKGNISAKTVDGVTKEEEKYHYKYNYTYDYAQKGTNLCYFFNGFLLSHLFPDNGEIFLIVANPNLLGKEIDNAIKHITSTENETHDEIYKTFEYDTKEYPTRVTGIVKQPDGKDRIYLYVVNWE